MISHPRFPARSGAHVRAALATGLLVLLPMSARAQAQWTANGVPVCVAPACYGTSPQICGDGAGGALIAWQRDRTGDNIDLYVHHVLANGSLASGWPVAGTPATLATGDQYLEDVASDGTGGAFVVWIDHRNWTPNGFDLYAQHVLGNGQIAAGWPADGLPVCTLAGNQQDARLLADGAGGAFIVWEDGRPGSDGGDIYAQHLAGDGTRYPGWPENGLGICTAVAGQFSPYLAADGQGGFIAAWTDERSGIGGLFAQRMAWSGTVAPGWPVNGRQIIAGGGVGGRGIHGMVPDGSGGAYMGWVFATTMYDADVYAIRFLADGSIAPGWPTGGFPVAALYDQQWLDSVAADSTGGVLIGWYNGYEQPNVAYVQRLRPNGTVAPGWPAGSVRPGDVLGFQAAPSVVPDGQGGTYVVYNSYGGSGSHDFIQHITATGALAPGWPTMAIPLVDPWTSSSYHQDAYFGVTTDGSGGAIVAWNDSRNGIQNQIYAQRYSGTGPTATLVSLVSVEALPDRVTLAWHRSEGGTSDGTIYRRSEEEAWSAIGRAAFDGSGRLTYEDRSVTAGERYAYRLGWIESGAEQFSAETRVDVPAALSLALEGARPNPAVGALNVAFTLPRSGRASLELLDVAGRQLAAREVGDLGAGRHLVRLNESRRTPPGVYWLRLTQAERTLVKRAVVIN